MPLDLALPILVGACAFTLVAALVVVRALRHNPRANEARDSSVYLETRKPERDPFIEGSASEKRETSRRRGIAMRVLIRGPGAERNPATGYVLDRSSGGLALCTSRAFPNGAFL